MERSELSERYGQPRRLTDLIDGKVLVFEHDTYESAHQYYLTNKEQYGHPGWVESSGQKFLSIVDLRPAIAELERNEE